jgi:molecular chaperone DnaK (HSP70)
MMNQCADMAGLTVLQMVHENVAAATYFGLERMDKDKPVHIMFYNMGG